MSLRVRPESGSQGLRTTDGRPDKVWATGRLVGEGDDRISLSNGLDALLCRQISGIIEDGRRVVKRALKDFCTFSRGDSVPSVV